MTLSRALQILAVTVSFVSCSLFADEKGGVVKFPETVSQKVAEPVSKVTPGKFFIIRSEKDVQPIVSPEGLVKFTKEEIPDKGVFLVKGIFADGTGKVETKRLVDKFLYFVDPVSTGPGEIIIFDGTSIIRRPIYASIDENGEPTPSPTPEPTPTPTPGPVSELYLVVIRDSANITPAYARVLGDTAFWDSLKKSGHQWNFFDDSPTDDAGRPNKAVGLGYIDAAKKIQTSNDFEPVLLILNKKTGELLNNPPIKLPTTKEGVLKAISDINKK